MYYITYLTIRYEFEVRISRPNQSDVKTLSLINLLAIPRFIGFNTINLDYSICQTLEESEGIKLLSAFKEKCALFISDLRLLNTTAFDNAMICFKGQILNYSTCFRTCFQLFDHLHDQLLPIFRSPRGYKFCIDCHYPHYYSATASEFIALILLQLPQINLCPNIEITYLDPTHPPTELPIEVISDWLNRKFDASEIISRKQLREKFLKIIANRIQNTQEMIDHLIKVYSIIF